MIALIPKWKNSEKNYNFDSIVNVARMYNEAFPEDCEIIIAMPILDLRHFLHEYGLYGLKIWSVYDSIQNIQIKDGNPISFKDLVWPENAEVIYQPRKILINLNDQIFANVLISKYGFVNKVVYFENSNKVKTYYYDDRGFLSRKEFISNQNIKKQYFDEYGHLIFQEKNGVISIQSEFIRLFKQSIYTNIEDLIFEKYEEHLTNHFKKNDRVIIDICSQNIKFVNSKLNKATCLFSDNEAVDCFVHDFDNIESKIFKNEVLLEKFNREFSVENTRSGAQNYVITPYKTEILLGISSEMENNIIYLYAHESVHPKLVTVVEQCISYIDKYPKTEFYVNTANKFISTKLFADLKVLIGRKFSVDMESSSFKIVQGYVDAKRKESLSLLQENQKKKLEKEGVWEKIELAVRLLEKFRIFSNENKFKFNADFNLSRLYVDLGNVPNQYLQTLSISYGIPQIVKRKSQFIVESKNGLILDHNFSKQISYFLENLSNWNISLVQNVALINKFSQDKLIKLWRGDF
ncbi:accessory Sec system protein Asp1 [Lactiplantibacillus plantarum]|uniref:accessory Sec system protein Asp1 n=1 Tax=Lactiplantibacillus plantarum TaxID=1590 RepID=UPI001BAE13FD|nr:accessory Sec system protein Asp1 [Lactiplantibacillus plantarum]MBS0956495.1 accessory Sec system protein Asp1 [Lactiplantibacillus plantarum]